ncbi:MAG TPA: M20/M25/M40 family metallo-hydrolase [Puia sp.]|jgi:aminopeptidase YwaD|nr:M20/M25/M40 family metallo-hydrolase [Puia sp.]
MISRIKFLTPILILPCLTSPTIAQKLKKTDKATLSNLQNHIHYLADPRLEGRRTGTPGEKAASDYISIALGQAGIQPKGDNNGWLQAFEIDQGREVSPDAYFIVNDKPFLLEKEYFPLSFSATTAVTGSPAIALQESGSPWFFDLRELLEANAGNSHFDLAGAIRAKAAASVKKGATALILYNSSRVADNLAFNPHERPVPAAIPVVYITREAKRKYLRDESASVDLRVRIGFAEKKRTGHNVVGFLNNGAATTVVIGAHYDQPGRNKADGMTANAGDSVFSNGADDNASGVAGMIELARMLAGSRLKANNYLFVAFSGEEQGLIGSRYLVEHSPVDVKKLNYMVNLDMIGRLSDSSHELTLGGFGSSPAWGEICNSVKAKKEFSLHLENSSDSPGDQASFYQRDIPVLFLFAGGHPDPGVTGDDYDKINYTGELEVLKLVYDIVEAANTRGRFAFTKPRG